MNTTIDPMWIWIALGAVALLVVVALIARGARRARTESLRNAYGREYDHTVQEAGSRKRAERELLARKEEVGRYEIRPLTSAERDRYRADWQKVEQHFIERPTMAVVEADELVAEIMRVQGYPMGDFEKHAAHLSVNHPRIVEHYRAGHRVISGAPGGASTEDLRQAMLHYRALFDELLDGIAGNDVARNDVVAGDVPRANEVASEERAASSRDFVRDEDRELRR